MCIHLNLVRPPKIEWWQFLMLPNQVAIVVSIPGLDFASQLASFTWLEAILLRSRKGRKS